MKFILDFDGRHQSNNMVDTLVDGEVYQPVDLSDVTDNEFLEVLDYLETTDVPDNELYVFIPSIDFDGGEAKLLYGYIRNNVNIKSFISRSI